MAITNFTVQHPSDKVKNANDSFGDGAPASTDKLVTDVKTFPKGSSYYDCTNFILYKRHAETGATTDFKKTVAFT